MELSLGILSVELSNNQYINVRSRGEPSSPVGWQQPSCPACLVQHMLICVPGIFSAFTIWLLISMYVLFLNIWSCSPWRLSILFPTHLLWLFGYMSSTHFMGIFLIPFSGYSLQGPYQWPLDLGVSMAPQEDEGYSHLNPLISRIFGIKSVMWFDDFIIPPEILKNVSEYT